MKKLLFYCVGGAAAALSLFSCKQKLNSPTPTPANYRVLSYSKSSSATVNLPAPVVVRPTIENYRFYYRTDDRVDKIIYTNNDPASINSMIIQFNYVGDTVIKNYYNALNNSMVRTDTFVVKNGFVILSNTPGLLKSREKTTYTYLGQLLATTQTSSYNVDPSYHYRGSTIDGPTTSYTSDNGDFLKHTYGTTLTLNIPPASFITPSGSYPLHVMWSSATGAVTNHDLTTGSLTDVLTNYDQFPITVTIRDSVDSTDTISYSGTLTYPGALWYNEGYSFYTTMANRPGDWLQIQSFTMFGSNIYRNNHLVKQISSVKGTMDITYDIDSYSKISRVTANTTDQYLNKYYTTYDIQYEVQ
jgi:hypothetical protein